MESWREKKSDPGFPARVSQARRSSIFRKVSVPVPISGIPHPHNYFYQLSSRLLTHSFINPHYQNMIFITFLTLAAALLSFSPVNATPLDRVGEIVVSLVNADYCTNNVGAGSVVAVTKDSSGGVSCGCSPVTGPENDQVACPTSATSSCTQTSNIASGGGAATTTAVCGTCTGGICNQYSYSDTKYINACASDENLYILLGLNNCVCSTPAAITASGINPNLAIECTVIPNAYARCRSVGVETTAGTAEETQNASCGYGCNTGYTITRNSLYYPTGCALTTSAVPNKRRAVAERKRRALEAVF